MNWRNKRPSGFGRRAFFVVLHSCQFEKRFVAFSLGRGAYASPRILSAAITGGSVLETDAKTLLPFRTEGVSPLSRIGIVCGLKRRDAL